MPGGRDAAERDTARRPALVGAVAGIALAVLAAGAAVTFLHGLSVDAVPTILMAAVLMVAVVFGLTYGLAAAVLALIAYQLLVGLPLSGPALASDDLKLMLLFGVGAVLAGRYTDVAHKRRHRAELLLKAGQPLSPHVGEPALQQVLSRTVAEWPERVSPWEELQRALVSFCIVGAGLAASLLAQDVLGPTAGMLCALGAVAVVGGALGARFGFGAGILAALVLNPLLGGGDLAEAGFIVIAFATLGWGVGRLSDQARQERWTLRTVLDAGRDLSTGGDEASVRRALLGALGQLSPRARVEVCGDGDAAVLRLAPAMEQPWAASDPRWRSHPLASDGREVGLVRWRFPGADPTTRNLDDIARSLIELAAAAVVRARLNAEKADMEFASQTEHLRTVLLDAVSHHFRSPLAGILGSVTSVLNLPDQHDRAVRRELLLIIKEQANRLSRYVDNFLSVARLESGAIVPKLAEVALEPLIYDVWETFGEAGGARRFLQARIDAETIRSDAALLGQVIGNVLENAIKYSPEGSIVEVRTAQAGDRLLIDVSDSGAGVPAAAAGRIFERFYRNPGAAAPGLGLGLYITRSLVNILGGEVAAHNRSDGSPGLTVRITLPAPRVAS